MGETVMPAIEKTASSHLCTQPEQMLRILETSRLAIIIFDSAGHCICASQAALSLFGASQIQQLRPLGSEGISPPVQPDGAPSADKWQNTVEQVRILGSLALEWEMLRGDGTSFLARVNLTQTRELDLLHCSIDDISDFKQATDRLEFLAYHDPLTSLPNRYAALEQLNRLLYQNDKPVGTGVISIKLKEFRELNDAYGHSMGNRLLKQVAIELSCALQPGFTLYRIAGPEYLLVVAGVQSHADLERTCEQLSGLCGRTLQVEDIGIRLQFRLGATLAPQDGRDPEKLLQQANMARKHARQDGLENFCLYEARMSDELLHFMQIRQRLLEALEKKEFELYYQPQLDLRSGKVMGIEALVRWNRPGHGVVAPGHFIGAAEDSGLIRPLGRWVIREACLQVAKWRAAGWTGLKVAVNVSAVQFRHQSVRWDVFDALEESRLPAECLELELTESLLLADGSAVSSTLSSWKEAGIKIAIDDFGTGYSSLSYLRRLAIDKIKIDRSFVSNLLEDNQDQSIVKAIIQMAKDLQMRTVAEGIECPKVGERLAMLGCEAGQGYFYAKPMPAEEFINWLHLWETGQKDGGHAGDSFRGSTASPFHPGQVQENTG